jgi:putative ABC transport system permease protein
VARPATGLISGETARRLGLAAGDTLAVQIAGATRRMTLVGLIEPADALSARAVETLLVTDIATAQELTGARGRLSRIDLIVPDDATGRGLLDRIRGALPPGGHRPAGARARPPPR